MAGLEGVPTSESDVAEWAQGYVDQQKRRMQADAQSGGRPQPPSRAEVTRAVSARFGDGSGRSLGPLTWLRILFWVAWILMAL